MLKKSLIAGVVWMASACLFGGATPMAQPLFVIERNTNANVVHYDARITATGDLDPREPVSAYWIMAAEDGRRQELNLLERSRVYGFTLESAPGGNAYRLELVAQKGREIYVHRQGGAVRAETVIGGHRAYLSKVYVSARRVLAIPSVRYIELFGTDVTTGLDVSERVQP